MMGGLGLFMYNIHRLQIRVLSVVMAYIFPWTEFQAARPVDAPHVRSSHLEDVQFKRLLEEDEVVVCHGEAVIVAG